jgi:hypothetical protein
MALETRQAPGWWPSLVVAHCTDCGWQSGTVDLNTDRGRRIERRLRDFHRCSSDWVVIQSEPGLWTVGRFHRGSGFHPASDHGSHDEAVAAALTMRGVDVADVDRRLAEDVYVGVSPW